MNGLSSLELLEHLVIDSEGAASLADFNSDLSLRPRALSALSMLRISSFLSGGFAAWPEGDRPDCE
jgi:hypothetical protein